MSCDKKCCMCSCNSKICDGEARFCKKCRKIVEDDSNPRSDLISRLCAAKIILKRMKDAHLPRQVISEQSARVKELHEAFKSLN